MKRFFVPAAIAFSVVLFSGCFEEEAPAHKPPAKKQPGFHPPSSTPTASNSSPDENPGGEKPQSSEPKPTPAETKPQQPAVPDQAPAKGELPYAKPVPGKPGFVFSPYDQSKGYIDVRGWPPGTEVKDPYFPGKSFLVP